MTSKPLPSNSVQAELRILGENISIARKRRGMTIRRVAEAASVTSETIRRLEKGEPGVSMGTVAMVFMALGEKGRFSNLLAPPTDDFGVAISLNTLPKRVRERGKKLSAKAENNYHFKFDGKYLGF